MPDKICQSCGVTMSERDNTVGTNFDGTLSSEYCSYCYDLGEFVLDVTLDEMVDEVVPMILEEDPGLEEDKVKEQMRSYLLDLRRWQKQEPVQEIKDQQ